MKRTLVSLSCILFACIALTRAAERQAPEKQSVYLRVLVPTENSKVFIDDSLTKQTGVSRLYVTPPLDSDKQFSYTVTAKWWPNNYTQVIRTRVVLLKVGQEVEVDLRKADDKIPDGFHIRYVPTPEEVVDAMCKLAGVGADDVVYDLGCGDGRIVITAVQKFKAKRGVGVDIDDKLVAESTKNAKAAGLSDKVTFRQQDVLTLKDLGDASVVMMYMGEDVNKRLAPILKNTLKPGSRIVSHDFEMGDWKPDQKLVVMDDEGDDHELYLWKIAK